MMIPVQVQGFVKIFDPVSGEVFVDKKNAIHYENMSISLAETLSHRTLAQGGGWIYLMAFGNGGSSVDPTGVITYLPPNTTGANADLYNETYAKVVDDNSAADTDVTNNTCRCCILVGRFIQISWLVVCWITERFPGSKHLTTAPISMGNMCLMN